jgi:branched-chain amino acid transport system ATP-binding protein
MTAAAIEARDLSAGYAGTPVVRGVNLHVLPGEVCALLGRNGAGKTTTLLTLAGYLPALGGQVFLGGTPTTAPVYKRVRQGLALVTDDKGLFYSLSTRDNLRLGRGEPQRALELFHELEPLLEVKAGLLSGGQQQMLALGRALAARPRVFLADEISGGLAPILVKRLLAALRQAADDGAAVLIVEQHPRLALPIADRAFVLQNGEVVLSGTGEELMGRIGEVEQAYLSEVTE